MQTVFIYERFSKDRKNMSMATDKCSDYEQLCTCVEDMRQSGLQIGSAIPDVQERPNFVALKPLLFRKLSARPESRDVKSCRNWRTFQRK